MLVLWIPPIISLLRLFIIICKTPMQSCIHFVLRKSKWLSPTYLVALSWAWSLSYGKILHLHARKRKTLIIVKKLILYLDRLFYVILSFALQKGYVDRLLVWLIQFVPRILFRYFSRRNYIIKELWRGLFGLSLPRRLEKIFRFNLIFRCLLSFLPF